MPFLIVTGAVLAYAMSLGVVGSLAAVISRQAQDARYIYYPMGSRDSWLGYKYYTTLSIRPEVLLVGSSRLQFARMSLISSEIYRGYNASVVGMRLWEIYDFMLALEQANALPEYLIINIDLPDFNANRVAFRQGRAIIEEQCCLSFSHELADSARLSLQQFFRSPLDFINLSESINLENNYLALGIETIEQRTGYRQDGSFYRRYAAGGNGLNAGLRWVESGKESFEYGQDVDMSALETLNHMLDFADEKGMQLIVVLPPYHPEIYAAMDFSEDYAYITDALALIHESFTGHNALLFDYTNPASLPISGEDFFDGWHLTERGNLKMWMAMLAEQPEVFGNFSSSENLEALLAESSRFYLPR